MKNYKGVQVRKKLMWYKHQYPDAPYGGLAIGMNLDDYRYKKQMFYEYWHEDNDGMKRYRISSSKAQELGMRYKLSSGVMPHMIPIEEWEVVEFIPREENPITEPKEKKEEKMEEKKDLTLF